MRVIYIEILNDEVFNFMHSSLIIPCPSILRLNTQTHHIQNQ